MLSRMNQRIFVLYDREHTIGHAYFLPLRDNPIIQKLGEIFQNRIIPLLQEYFCEDYEKNRLVLGDNKKTDDSSALPKVSTTPSCLAMQKLIWMRLAAMR